MNLRMDSFQRDNRGGAAVAVTRGGVGDFLTRVAAGCVGESRTRPHVLHTTRQQTLCRHSLTDAAMP
jgi:hypothetical protein